MTRARFGVFLLVLSLLAIPLAAHAQDPLTETYTATNGALTFNYPADWVVDQAGPEVFLSNTANGIQASNPSQLLPGEFMMDILVDPELMSTFGILPSGAPEDYYNVLAPIVVSNFTATDPGQPVDTTVNGHAAVRGDASGPAGDTFLIAFELDQGIVGAAIALSPKGDLAAFMPTIEAILDTVAYNPPLNLTFTASDGALTFNYPMGWLAAGIDETQALIANSTEVAGQQVLAPGMLQAYVLAPSVFINQFGLPIDTPVPDAISGFLDILARNRPDEYDFSAVTPLGGGGLAGASSGTFEARSSTQYYDALVWGKAVGEFGTVAIFANTGPGGMAQFEPVLKQIFDSIAYAPPPPPVVNGSVVWQYQQPVSYSGDQLFGTLGGMDVAPDDTLVIADGPNGLQIFAPDGSPITTIKNPDILFAFDVTLDAQGNYWVTDSGKHQLVQLDPQGNTLQSFGEVGTDPGTFGDNTDSPTLIDFGPDGNLYIYVKYLDPNGDQEAFGFVQVWTTEGQFLGQFSTQPPNLELFPSPVDMAFGPDGNLYMVNAEGVIRVFNPADSNDIRSHTDFRLITKANSLTVAPNGDLYIGALGGTVYHYSADLQYIDQFGNPQPALPTFPSKDPYESGDFTAPSSVGVFSNGDVVVTDTNFTYSQIVRIAYGPSTSTGTTPSASPDAPSGGAAGGNGLGSAGKN